MNKNIFTAALFVFLRFPRPGKVKTRLAQSLGEKRAAQFYRICTDAILSEISRLPENIKKYIFCADKTDEPEIRRWAGPGFNFAVQEGESLGQRLENAFSSVFGNGVQKAIAVASDVPDLSADILNEAIQALDEHDIAIGPCYDGGYYLLGMKRLHHELFDGISWSTEQVYRQTLAAARESGLTVHQLQTLIDIDTEADLHKWSEMDKHHQPAFDEFLKTIGLKPIAERI
jgi:rSAM/selenodomain-associated transferase 1